jgi:hypothetical protein
MAYEFKFQGELEAAQEAVRQFQPNDILTEDDEMRLASSHRSRNGKTAPISN